MQRGVEYARQYRIKNKYTMRIKELLTEGATDVLYHFMTTAAAVRTLMDNHYSLESSTGMDAEERWQPKGKHWYLATTRSKVGDYTVRNANDSGAVFQIDGRWIGQRYSVTPMDYWEGSNRPSDYNRGPDARTSESEDRVFSTTHSIPLRGSTVAVHVFVIPVSKLQKYSDPERHGYTSAEVRRIIELANGRGIPVYLYDDKAKWMSQQPKYRIALDSDYAKQLIGGVANTQRFRRPYVSDYHANIRFWVEIMQKNATAELSEPARKLIYELKYYGKSYTSLQNDMHNAGRDPTNADYPFVIQVNQFMRSNGITKLADLEQFLKKKWLEIIKGEEPAAKQSDTKTDVKTEV